MKTTEILFNTEQKFSPVAREIVSEAVREIYPDGARMVFSEPDNGVIGFGTKGNGMIRCLSPAQIATAPNAISAVRQALVLHRDGPPPIPELDYRIIDSKFDYARALHLIGTRFDEPVTIDIEYGPWPDHHMLAVSMTWGDTGIMVFPEEFLQGPWLEVLAHTISQCYYIIGHNWKSDARVIMQHTGVKLPTWFDTMLAHHVLYMAATGQHGLKEMAESMLGVPDWDTDLYKHTGKGDKADFTKAPRDMLYKYNALDVLYTHELYRELMPQVEVKPDFWHEVRASNSLLDVENNRIKVDLEYIEDLSENLEQAMEDQLAKLPEGLNPNSPKQLKEYFASEGLQLPNTAEETLLKVQDHPAVKPILEFRKAKKLHSTYCKAYLSNHIDGFIKPNYNVHGTSTGRLSSSKPFNAQNIPREERIKRIFIPRGEGRKVIGVDYSQAELRVMSMLSGDKDMQALFQPDSPDFFDALMPGVYPEQFESVAAYERFEREHPATANELRTVLKSVVYGLGFGRQAKAIGQAIGATEEYAQGIIDNFLNSFPAFKEWRLNVMDAAVFEGDREMLVTKFGREFNSEIVTPRNRQNVINAGLAFLPQSTASDLTLTSMIRANDYFKKEMPEVLITNIVHDAIYADAPEDVAQDAADKIAQIMSDVGREVFGDAIVFSTEAKVGDSWAEV